MYTRSINIYYAFVKQGVSLYIVLKINDGKNKTLKRWFYIKFELNNHKTYYNSRLFTPGINKKVTVQYGISLFKNYNKHDDIVQNNKQPVKFYILLIY